jgi:hypothetical protein
MSGFFSGAYGIDSEESRPVINIGVLIGGDEYEPIMNRVAPPGPRSSRSRPTETLWITGHRRHCLRKAAEQTAQVTAGKSTGMTFLVGCVTG